MSCAVAPSSAEPREESGNFATPVASDRFATGWMDSTYSDSGGEDVDIRIYYPAQNEGEGKAMDCAWAPYPWVVFHGDNGEEHDAYSWIGEGLARAGYVVVTLGEERDGDEEYRAASDHAELIAKMGYINQTGDVQHSPPGSQGCIDMGHWGVAGHGEGAGVATAVFGAWGAWFPTGSYEPPRALFGLGFDSSETGTNVAAVDIANPNLALFLTGTADTVAPINEHIDPMLDQWQGGWQLLEVVGANHVQYEDDQSWWDNLFDGEATMTAEDQQAHAISKVKPYLDLVLKGDDESWLAGTSRAHSYPDQGSDSESYLSENLDLIQFYRMSPLEQVYEAPVARQGHHMFFDQRTNLSVLFGGLSHTSEPAVDSWSLDLANDGEWIRGQSLSELEQSYFAYDGDSMGLYMGVPQDGGSSQWSWNGFSGSWSAYPEGVRPNASAWASMSWSSGEDAFIFFGGVDDSWHPVNETWKFDPDIGVWQELVTQSNPSGVISPATFDGGDWNRTFLFGGANSDFNLTNETWMFDGSTGAWSKLALSGAHPSSRAQMAVAENHEDGVVYLLGGYSTTGYLADLWQFNLDTLEWSEIESSGLPSGQAGWSMTYDSSLDRLVMFGVCSQSSCDETWWFDFTNGTWHLYSSSSAVTATSTIEMMASVIERDYQNPPVLTVECMVDDETEWILGSWNSSSNEANCSMVPFGISPGLHTMTMRVRNHSQQASYSTAIEIANSPPRLNQEEFTGDVYEGSSLSVNASDIAVDDDGHDLKFVRGSVHMIHDGESNPELSFDVSNKRRTLTITDESDWIDVHWDIEVEVCGVIEDEAPPGQNSATIDFCMDVVIHWVDDPYVVLGNPSFELEEDFETFEFDISQYISDPEGIEPRVYWLDNGLDYYDSDINPIRFGWPFNDDETINTTSVWVGSIDDWNGEFNTSFCVHPSDNFYPPREISTCSWIDATFVVTPTPDPPEFNFTTFTLEEDTVTEFPIAEIVTDPDGDEVNLTLEVGEDKISIEVWYDVLRITPQEDWFGRSVNWAIVASDGIHEIRTPIKVTVNPVDDETLVSWATPDKEIENLTSLRFDVIDKDSDGPWLVEYNWDDGDWSQLSPSCASSEDGVYECQVDILTYSLEYGDHELNLRVNDGDSNSGTTSFWLEKVDPNSDSLSPESSGIPAIAFVGGGLLLLLAGAGAVVFLMRVDD